MSPRLTIAIAIATVLVYRTVTTLCEVWPGYYEGLFWFVKVFWPYAELGPLAVDSDVSRMGKAFGVVTGWAGLVLCFFLLFLPPIRSER